MKPKSPPRRRVVRMRMFGGNGSAMFHKYKAEGNAAVVMAQDA